MDYDNYDGNGEYCTGSEDESDSVSAGFTSEESGCEPVTSLCETSVRDSAATGSAETVASHAGRPVRCTRNVLPQRFTGYDMTDNSFLAYVDPLISEPLTYNEAMSSSNSVEWQNAMKKVTTSEPGVSIAALEEAIPSLTVASIIGVALVVLVAIALVFVLGVLIDCRQQRLLNEKMGEMKRARSTRSRRAPAQEGDSASIVNNEEAPATSLPPAAMLRDVP